MGKNRTNSNNSSTENEPMYYSKYTWENVPQGNLDNREMGNLMYYLKEWLEGGSSSPDYGLDKEHIEYIVDHMKSTENSPDVVPDGHLYRLENGRHFAENELEVGKHLHPNGAFTSFSKEVSATNIMLESGWRGQTDLVIYRTVGNTPFFDPKKYSDPYSYQKECFVPAQTMQIKDIKEYSTSSQSPKEITKELSKYGINIGNYFETAPIINGSGEQVKSIKIVDVAYDPTVTAITSSKGDTVPMPEQIV